MFNDKYGLTKAVLDGRKTQTRRIVPQSVIEKYAMLEDPTIIDDARYEIGDIVAIAQSYKDIFSAFSQQPNPQLNISVKNPTDTAGWNNKMFVKPELMPHQIRITDVRVERLQDISDEDCLAEGIIKGQCGSADTHFMEAYYVPNYIQPYCKPQYAYEILIDKVSGKGTWEKNPYVFVYDFELVK